MQDNSTIRCSASNLGYNSTFAAFVFELRIQLNFCCVLLNIRKTTQLLLRSASAFGWQLELCQVPVSNWGKWTKFRIGRQLIVLAFQTLVELRSPPSCVPAASVKPRKRMPRSSPSRMFLSCDFWKRKVAFGLRSRPSVPITWSCRCQRHRQKHRLSPYMWSMWCLKREARRSRDSSSSSPSVIVSRRGGLVPRLRTFQAVSARLAEARPWCRRLLQRSAFERRVFCPCVRRNKLLDAHVRKPRGVDAVGDVVSA